jgi:low affinity Fe/Cu permease
MKVHTGFGAFARRISRWSGQSWSFALALLVVLVWGITGPTFGYSDTWQLVINTGTTIVTFLMVFLIQNTQNRDSEAMQMKLDELIRSIHGAHNALVNLEELEDAELDRIRENYSLIAERARRALERGRSDTGVPPVDMTNSAGAPSTKA